jgi:hypothetical protein
MKHAASEKSTKLAAAGWASMPIRKKREKRAAEGRKKCRQKSPAKAFESRLR